MTFKKEDGGWTKYRELPDIQEVDFHWNGFKKNPGSFWDNMSKVYDVALEALKSAYEESGSIFGSVNI